MPTNSVYEPTRGGNPKHTGQFSEAIPTPLTAADDLPAPSAPLSQVDAVSASVLDLFESAQSWEVASTEYDNGYYYEFPVLVTLADGAEFELEESDFSFNLTDLSDEQDAGYAPLFVELAAFKSGVREPGLQLTAPNPDDDENGFPKDFAGSLADQYPDIATVTLCTERTENGYYWAWDAQAVGMSGEPVSLELAAFDSVLNDATSSGPRLGRDTEITFTLR